MIFVLYLFFYAFLCFSCSTTYTSTSQIWKCFDLSNSKQTIHTRFTPSLILISSKPEELTCVVAVMCPYLCTHTLFQEHSNRENLLPRNPVDLQQTARPFYLSNNKPNPNMKPKETVMEPGSKLNVLNLFKKPNKWTSEQLTGLNIEQQNNTDITSLVAEVVLQENGDSRALNPYQHQFLPKP